MDRLHALTPASVLAAALIAFACDGVQTSAPPSVSRVEAVAAKAPAHDPIAELCDVRHAPGQGPSLSLPALDGPLPSLRGAQWLNVWATWCKPCVEELPMIERFRVEQETAGRGIGVSFVSVDASSELLAAFRVEHPDLPATHRLADPSTASAYLQSLGLDAGAGLPVHAWTGSDGKLRCVRSGAVVQADLEAIASLLQ